MLTASESKTKSPATAQSASDWKFPRLLTELPGPNAKRVLEADKKFMSPSYTRDYPLVAQRGRGAVVEDVDGNMFLDFAAGIAVCSTGHCHPKVVEAIQKQAAELIHMSGTDFYYESLPYLAERLAKSVGGSEDKKVFFCNSGTEAVEGAVKLARYTTKRDKMIAFYGCFHGRTMGSLSLTASKSTQRKNFGALLSGVEHIPYPYAYRCAHGHGPETCGEEILEQLENQIFKRLFEPTEVAGIIIEPIQGEGGYVPAPKFFLQELQRICRQHGIMLICDEVQSGMGRTGNMWAHEYAGIEPDILCSAKGIASGMPLGAIIARSSVMNWKPGAHGTTFGGNPVCLAQAIATLDLLEDCRLDEEIENRRRRSRARLDDRHRNRARSKNGGARGGSAQRDCGHGLPQRIADPWRGRKYASSFAAAGHRRRTSRLCGAHARRVHPRSGKENLITSRARKSRGRRRIIGARGFSVL